jgi:AraC-like DNA-binding protein
MNASVVPAITLQAMLAGFEALGLSMAPLREACGAAAAAPPETPVPALVLDRLRAAASRQRPEPEFPTALGLAIPFGAFGLTDYLAGSSDAVAGGFESLALHLRLVARGISLELSRIDGERWVRVLAGDAAAPWSGSEMTVAVFVARFRQGTGGRFQPSRVLVRAGAPGRSAVHEALLGVPVETGAPAAALVMDEAAWRLPLRGADPCLRGVLQQALVASGLEAPGVSDLEQAIRARLRDALPAATATPVRVARLLGMSERTLQRRLGESGSSFTALLEDFRRAEAMRLLADTDVALAEVAARLGYAEQTSFTRAFRRWSDTTPAAWRAARRPVHRVGRIAAARRKGGGEGAE